DDHGLATCHSLERGIAKMAPNQLVDDQIRVTHQAQDLRIADFRCKREFDRSSCRKARDCLFEIVRSFEMRVVWDVEQTELSVASNREKTRFDRISVNGDSLQTAATWNLAQRKASTEYGGCVGCDGVKHRRPSVVIAKAKVTNRWTIHAEIEFRDGHGTFSRTIVGAIRQRIEQFLGAP